MSQPEETAEAVLAPSVRELVRAMVPEHAHLAQELVQSSWKWSTPAGWWEVAMPILLIGGAGLVLRGTGCAATVPHSATGVAALRALLVELGGLPPHPPAASRPGWWAEGCRCTVGGPELLHGVLARVVRLNGCPLHSAVGEP